MTNILFTLPLLLLTACPGPEPGSPKHTGSVDTGESPIDTVDSESATDTSVVDSDTDPADTETGTADSDSDTGPTDTDTAIEDTDWSTVPEDAVAPWAAIHYLAVAPDGTEYRYDCESTDTDRETLVLCGPYEDGTWQMQLMCQRTSSSFTEVVAIAVQASAPLTTSDLCSDEAQAAGFAQAPDGSYLFLDCHLAEAGPDYEFVLSRAEFPDAVTMVAEGHFGGTITYDGADYTTSGDFAARLEVSEACS